MTLRTLKTRSDYGSPWIDWTGPVLQVHEDPTGMMLMVQLQHMVAQCPSRHLALYVDDELNVGYFPNANLAAPLEVRINGQPYTRD
jgi:hypothetical protein